MDAADRHVERFKRDCLKVCVIYAGRSAGELIRRAERAYGRVDPNLALEAAALVRDRYGILIKEVLGDADAAANWAALLLRIETFRERVIQSYRLLDERKYWLPLLIAKMWRWFSGAVAWVVLAILALAVGSAVIPHPEAFGEKAQAYVLRLTGALLGVRATGPGPAVRPGR